MIFRISGLWWQGQISEDMQKDRAIGIPVKGIGAAFMPPGTHHVALEFTRQGQVVA